MENTTASRYTMTVREFAQSIGVSLPTAYEMTHTQGFPVLVIGRKRLVLVAGLEQWLAKQAEGGTRCTLTN